MYTAPARWKAMSEKESLSKKEKRALAKEKKQTKRRNGVLANKAKVWGVVLLVLGLLGYGGWRLWAWIQTPVGIPSEATTVLDDEWIKGSPDAPVTLIEYGDFECPACAAYYPLVKQVSEEMSDTLRVVYRHFPLTQHKNAHPAAAAAEAAGMQGKFWEMHDMLYERQNEWANDSNPSDIFVSYAKELELDIEKFKSDVDSDVVDKAIAADIVMGNQTGVSATPSFVLNGQLIRAPRSVDKFKSLVQSVIPSESQ